MPSRRGITGWRTYSFGKCGNTNAARTGGVKHRLFDVLPLGALAYLSWHGDPQVVERKWYHFPDEKETNFREGQGCR